MTVRSKQQSSQRASAGNGANVVTLPASRSASAGKCVTLSAPAGTPGNIRAKGADLLSIRRHLSYIASIGVNDLEFIEKSYSAQVASKLTADVRDLLDQEFGHLRVHRQRKVFVVSHYCMESLFAGLFRVQYHSRQIPLPDTRDGAGLSDNCGVPLTWGVGKTMAEAESERHRKGLEKL